MLLEGLHIPLTTPFHSDGRVALPKLAANVARYSKTPAVGLIVLGPSAEPTLLSDDETRDVLRTAAQAAAPEKVLLAGIARDSVRSVLALADFAAQQHYDAVLVAEPSVATDARELLVFFQTIADRSPLPVILLSTGTRPLTVNTVAELAAHSNILGLIDYDSQAAAISDLHAHTTAVKREVTVTSTFAAVTARMRLASETTAAPALITVGSLSSSTTAVAEPPPLAPALRTRTKSVGFQILSGNSSSLLAALNAGVVGIAPAFAAAAPQACYEVYAAWKDGDSALAEEKQLRLREAAALAESLGPSSLKYACDLNGYAGGSPRLPHLPPTGDQRANLESAMRGLRN
ncbi:MAG TPA: dihydrodipicolinate synthase family protein [Acidobacteriaceae bacterium]